MLKNCSFIEISKFKSQIFVCFAINLLRTKLFQFQANTERVVLLKNKTHTHMRLDTVAGVLTTITTYYSAAIKLLIILSRARQQYFDVPRYCTI